MNVITSLQVQNNHALLSIESAHHIFTVIKVSFDGKQQQLSKFKMAAAAILNFGLSAIFDVVYVF